MSKKIFKKRKDKKNKKERDDLYSLALSLLEGAGGKAYNIKQLTKKLGLKKKALAEGLYRVLSQLEEEGKVRQLENGAYLSTMGPTPLTGKVDHVNPRFAYVVVEGRDHDIYVRSRDLGSAVHGDIVELSLLPSRKGASPEGKVNKVVERSRTRFVGRIEVSPNYSFIVPDYKKLYQDFFVHQENIGQAKTNDKVVFEVTKWAKGDRNPEAKVTEVLGKTGENEAEIHSIMAEFDLPFRFGPDVLKESESIQEDITKTEIKKRKDFREVLTFTIDPEDAKDFDDAISFRELDNGHYEVGVHIADVTHYVRPGSVLDQDAYDRATSVYLVDRTVPMLPERLSNQLCSLRPKEDKLTFCALFEIDGKAKVHSEWFGRTVIHSDFRLSYEQAQAQIEGGEGGLARELQLLNQIAHKLRKDRFAKGAVNFETTEVKFRLDEKGKPLEVVPKVRKDAHKLIEEFMLLANRAVATFVFKMKRGGSGTPADKQGNTFVYRTHDHPDPDKVMDFAQFAKQFGHKVNVEESAVSRSLNKLMDEIEGKPEQHVLQQLAVRAMAKAKYTTEAKGHFGLAFPHYTHFTSPIRRYPDMMVHRLLQHYLDGGKPVNKKEYEDKCVHSSEREKRAADAERASVKYKQVEFMSMAADKVYEGIITGVTDFGVFVEMIETKCEGMVRLSDMADDFYEFDERNFRIIGRRRKKIYRLGDNVNVRIKKTDIARRLIDLVVET